MSDARKALENVRMGKVGGSWCLARYEIDAILTALAQHLRTPGTVEVCQHYRSASCGENEDHPNMGVCGRKACPRRSPSP